MYWEGYCAKGLVNTPCDRIGCVAYYPRPSKAVEDYFANSKPHKLWEDALKGKASNLE
jgi:hypothetical protein